MVCTERVYYNTNDRTRRKQGQCQYTMTEFVYEIDVRNFQKKYCCCICFTSALAATQNVFSRSLTAYFLFMLPHTPIIAAAAAAAAELIGIITPDNLKDVAPTRDRCPRFANASGSELMIVLAGMNRPGRSAA